MASSTESSVPLAALFPDAPTKLIHHTTDTGPPPVSTAQCLPRPSSTAAVSPPKEKDNDPLRLCGSNLPLHTEVVLERRIGRGGFGQVYRALDTNTGRRLAVKVIQKPDRQSRAHLLKEEIRIHELLNDDPGVPTLLYVEHDEFYVYLAMELCGQTTLVHHWEFWKSSRRTQECFEAKRDILLRAVDLLIGCHDRGVYHRDIKPENILLRRDGSSIKIIDFGLSVDSMISKNTKTGTVEYMSPECFNEFSWNNSSFPFLSAPNDVWSLGVLLFWFMVGEKAWIAPSFTDINFAAYMTRPDIHFAYNFGLTFEAQHILRRALHINPLKRATIHEFRTLLALLDGFFVSKAESNSRDFDIVSTLPAINQTELTLALQAFKEFSRRRSSDRVKLSDDARLMERKIQREQRDLDQGVIPLEYSRAVQSPGAEITPENVVIKAQQYLAQSLGMHSGSNHTSSKYHSPDPRHDHFEPTPSAPLLLSLPAPRSYQSRTPGQIGRGPTLPSLGDALAMNIDIDIVELHPLHPGPSQGTLGTTLVVTPRMGGTTALPTEEVSEEDIGTMGLKRLNNKRELAQRSNIAVGPSQGGKAHNDPGRIVSAITPVLPEYESPAACERVQKGTPLDPTEAHHFAPSASDLHLTSFLPEIVPLQKQKKRHFLGLNDILRRVSSHMPTVGQEVPVSPPR